MPVSNENLRRQALGKDRFLLRVPRRDSSEFAKEFAAWLGDENCRIPLVRLCFEQGIDEYRAKCRKEMYPSELIREAEAVLPRAERRAHDRLTMRLQKRVRDFRRKLISQTVDRLSKLHPYDQVTELNDRLVGGQPAPSSREQTRISHEDVQAEYYRCHPQLSKWDVATEDLISRDFGLSLAGKLGRPWIPGDAMYLSRIAVAIRSLRTPVRDDRLCTERPNRLVAALTQIHQQSPALLRELTAFVLRVRLMTVVARKMRDEAALGKIVWWKITRLVRLKAKSSDNLTRILIQRCWRCYRLAGNSAIVRAANDYFFHGLPVSELQQNPGIFAKLNPAFEADIKCLCDVLFGSPSGKRKMGLIQQWATDDAPGSMHRLKLVDASTHDWELSQKQHGRTETEYFQEQEAVAGLQPVANQGLVKARLDARLNRRKRSGLK